MNGHANASGYYEPAEDGKAAFIIAAQILEKIVDLVAFRLGDEDYFWRRRGVLGLLGLPVADWCHAMGASLAVYASPLSWLRRGGAGVCMLDLTCWKTQSTLQKQHHLICENENLAAGIDALVLRQEPRELPTISYQGS